MGIFDSLFGSKKLKTLDADFGEIKSFCTNGNRVGWQVNKKYFNSDIEILIDGDVDGIFNSQKQILLHALNNEPEIKSESEKALKEQFDNAEMKFVSLDTHFSLKGILVNDEGFEMSFQEKGGKNYFFNVHFKNNKQVGVSIDG